MSATHRPRYALAAAALAVLALAGCVSTHAKATTHRTATPSQSASAAGYTDSGGYGCDQAVTDDLGNCPENPAYASASATPTGPGNAQRG